MGLFVSGIWRLQRLSAEHRAHTDLTVMLPPPEPSGGPVAAKVTMPPRKQPHVVTRTVQPTVPRLPEIQDATGGGEPRGPGAGPGAPTDTGDCTEGCRAASPDPVCGDGTVETGEQCDDQNTADGDGCSATCQLEPRPRPTAMVPPGVLLGLRIAGDTQVHPDAVAQNLMVRDNASRVRGVVKLCIATYGSVAHTAMLVSTRYDSYDAALLSAVRGWRYQPYTIHGAPVAACSTVTFVYTLR